VQAFVRTPITEADLRAMLLPTLNDTQREQLAAGKDVDFSYEVRSFAYRFRVNVFRQSAGIAAVFRVVRQRAAELESLGLPPVVASFAEFPHGLVLVGGPTGSGKSTTLAALIDHLNAQRAEHVVTIEDPIEVRHTRRQCVINQRELGAHTWSFGRALRSTLRQDPDVILVGEMRDLETIEFAVNAAETGHLVLATVHTVSAASSVDRIVHAFPPIQQGLVRSMLAESLRAVLTQQLLRRIDVPGQRVLACEVLINNDAVANLIRKDKCFQIPSVIATHAERGMRSMDGDLERLVKTKVIDPEEALMRAVEKEAFAQMLVAAGFLPDLTGPRTSLPPDRPPSAPAPAS
jgi:twitching motility protein PilT